MKYQYVSKLLFKVRRLLPAVPIIFTISLANVAAPQDQDLWAPKPRPAICTGTISVELLELDVSGSMKSLLPELKTQVNRYIDAAPVCTSMVIGTFGETADVRADDFLVDQKTRERLKDIVRNLRATQQHTNLDEVAKAIEWLTLRLQSAYGADGYSLAVKVLSDQISAPSGEKPKFSLQKYLERHLAGGHLQVVEVEVVPQGTQVVPAPVGAREISVKVPIDQLLGVLEQKSSSAAAPGLTIPESKEPAANLPIGRREGTKISGRSALVIYGLPAFLIASGLALLALRRKSTASASPPNSSTPQPEVPVALLVQEIELPKEGDALSQETVLRERVRVSVLPNVPVRFGTDANASNYVVVPGDGIARDEIFRLTPARGPVLYLRATKGTTCAGKPVPSEGVRVSARDPITITHGRRQWRITPSFTSHSQDAGEALFAPRESKTERSAA
jgi:hypothetical protein